MLLKQTSKQKFQSFNLEKKKAQQSLQNLTAKLTGLAGAGMRRRVLWSVKMFWALETVWTAARLVTTVSPDNSRLREPARTCGKHREELHLFHQMQPGPRGGDALLAAAIPPPAQLLHAHRGRHYFPHLAQWVFSCQIKNWKTRRG